MVPHFFVSGDSAAFPSYSVEKAAKIRQELTVKMLLLLSLLRHSYCVLIAVINHFKGKRSGFPQKKVFLIFVNNLMRLQQLLDTCRFQP